MSGAIHPLPQYAFMAWCLVKKCRDNFTFLPFTGSLTTLELTESSWFKFYMQCTRDSIFELQPNCELLLPSLLLLQQRGHVWVSVSVPGAGIQLWARNFVISVKMKSHEH